MFDETERDGLLAGDWGFVKEMRITYSSFSGAMWCFIFSYV